MTKKSVKIECSKEKAELLYKELGKLRCYMTGWEAAGKMTPPGYQAVWQVQQLLKNAV